MILCVALFVLHTMGLRAQQSDAPPGADSLSAVRRAHDAQREFEQIRRIDLPTTFDDYGRCDEHIGRYCYWYDPSDPPAEPVAIATARDRLVHELTAASRRAPGDGWIVGQVVRYLVEHGLADSAAAVARRCTSARWWCDALEGFADHMARDYTAAEEAFARALQAMPSAERCAWTDLTMLLGDDDRYRSIPCADRAPVNQRIWWLARPLYTRPGNDLETEHYARQTMALLQTDAEPSDGMRWGDDSRELMLRFGWPTRWARAPDRPSALGPPNIIGDEPAPSFWLFPTPAVTPPWADVTELRWEPTLEQPPARYAPPYARGFAPIDQVQFARFRRGDSTIAVAAFDLTPDSVFATRAADVRLAVSRDPATPAVIGEASTMPRGLARTTSPWRPAVLSLEAVGIDTAWVARARAMTPPDPGPPPAISDILLFTPGDVLPDSLAAALPLALQTALLPSDRPVGLYWEMYTEADSAAPTDIAVTVAKVHAKGDRPYPVGRPSCPLANGSIRLRWREEPSSRPTTPGRAVVVDLRTLSRGRYVVAIQVIVGDRPRGCSSREIQVVTR